MDARNLYDNLIHAKGSDDRLIVTFDDGDEYLLSDIDLCYSTNQDGTRENEPLDVDFAYCLNKSWKKLEAERNEETAVAGVWWTSSEPIEPVGMRYEVECVVRIWDAPKGYFVFERENSIGTR